MSRYYLQDGDRESSEPIEFRQLVRMVRDGDVRAEHRVREEHGSWQFAGDVIGLFHLAGRADVLELWEQETLRQQELQRKAELNLADGDAISVDEIESLLEHAESLVDEEEEPSWKKRLREVEAQRAAAGAELAAANADEAETARIQGLKDKAIQDALAAVDGRYFKSRLAGVWQGLSAMFSSHTLHLMFRFGSAILAGNLAAAAILSWSDTEAQRFPSTSPEKTSEMIFPFWGSCSEGEYYFLLFDAAIFTAVIGYVAAIQLERMADD